MVKICGMHDCVNKKKTAMFALLIKADGKQKEAGSHSKNKIFHFQ